MGKKIIYIFLLLSFYSSKTFTQSKADFKDCLIKIFELEEINPLLFSLKKSNGDSILCIGGRSYFINNEIQYLQTEDFDCFKRYKIYVKSQAFIEGYEIGYWLSIDSVQFEKDSIDIEFKTTKSHIKVDDFTYFVGRVSFVKKGDIWQIDKKEIQLNKFIPFYIIDSDYVDEVRERNKKYIKEVRKKRAKKKTNESN